MRYKRRKYVGRRNRRQFSRVAKRVHVRNLHRTLSRGGIRL